MSKPRGTTAKWEAKGLGLALGLALALVPGWARAQMLAAIPVEPSTPVISVAVPMDSTELRTRFHAVDALGLARFLGQPEGQDEAPGHLDLTLVPGKHPDVASLADAMAASFIVDFDDPAIGRLRQQLVAEQGGSPIDGAQVTAFVAKSMRVDYAANADFASQVALSLQGDCTEHSLLTAALARSLKIPARIVQGVAMVHADGRWHAYGHAWVQMHEAGRWVVRDSALASWPGPVYYVPAFVVADEGPGHKLSLLRTIGRLPSRIELLGAGPGR